MKIAKSTLVLLSLFSTVLYAHSAINPQRAQARRALASNFYHHYRVSQRFIQSALKGMNFHHPVHIVTLPRGKHLQQIQIPGGKQDGFYGEVGTRAVADGINPNGEYVSTHQHIHKVINIYEVVKPVKAIKSIASPIIDDWSIPEAPFYAKGGALQYWAYDLHAFKLLKTVEQD